MRLGLHFYTTKIFISLNDHVDRPVILACNHPNSFFDALILGSHYKKPVHFLARGDVFSKPIINKLLRSLNMIPVFRNTEGREQLKYNEASFKECIEVLKKNGSLLIFSEGVCKNEWIVRPLKKGTARLALMGWQDEIIKELSIIPVTFSYSSFYDVPLKVYVKEGKPIMRDNFTTKLPAQFYSEFNGRLKQELEKNLVLKEELMHENKKPGVLKKLALAIPACVGYITHKPFYNLCRAFALSKTVGTVFFHSVFFGILLLTYPVILFLFTAICVCLTHNHFLWLLLLLLPLTAYCYKEYKG